MPDRGGREFSEAWVSMLSAADYARLPELLHPDCVHEYPQSGERVRGIANIRAIFEQYPGGLGGQDRDSLRVTGDSERWAIAPNFTLIRSAGGAGSYTSAMRARYPDGSEWYVISMFELVNGRQSRATMFFAQVFDAPEWRQPFAEKISGT
jgi:SnoaL-like protein